MASKTLLYAYTYHYYSVRHHPHNTLHLYTVRGFMKLKRRGHIIYHLTIRRNFICMQHPQKQPKQHQPGVLHGASITERGKRELHQNFVL